MESITIPKKLFTVDDCYRMLESGVLSEDDRFELIEGELIDMGPMSSKHARCISYLNENLILTLNKKAYINPQLPLHFDNLSEPEPDILVLKRTNDLYIDSHPTPKDVLLLIEVSLTTLHIDMNIKLPLYATHGICETWIVDLEHDQIHQFTNPSGEQYRDENIYTSGETISAKYIENLSLQVNDILGINL